jgi:hypothetical protein
MNLLCRLRGHDTQGWDQIPDRFFFNSYAPDAITVNGDTRILHLHKQVPAWWHFFGHGQVEDPTDPMEWTDQECRCRRCGILFWEAEFFPFGRR